LELADSAQVAGGKLFVPGAGWSIIVPGGPLAVCGIIGIPWHQGSLKTNALASDVKGEHAGMLPAERRRAWSPDGEGHTPPKHGHAVVGSVLSLFMPTVLHDWAPGPGHTGLYQAQGRAHWWWERGDSSNYCAFSIRPAQANMDVEVVRQWTVSNNDLVQTEHWEVDMRTPGGGLLTFNTIAVIGS
jgi:hypothetical protein